MASAYVVTRKGKSGRRYLVRYNLGRGRESAYKSGGTFLTRREAEARAAYIRAELAAMRVPRLDLEAVATDNRLAAVAARYIEGREVDASPATVKVYRQAEARLGALADVTTEQVTTADVQEWVNAVASALAPATVRKYLDLVRATLDYAGREFDNPARSRHLRLPRQQVDEINPPPFAHVAAILRTISPRHLLPVRLMEATGLRIAETMSLTWGDLDVPGLRLRVARSRTKGNTAGQRWVPVPAGLMDDLGALRPAEDRDATARVFDGISDQAVRLAMARACKHAEVPHYSPHDLRHRFISLRIRAGWDAVTVARLVGHGKASITLDTYSHVMIEEPAHVMDALSRCASVVPSGMTALDAFASCAGASPDDGGYRDRTGDLYAASVALSQLS